jgi:hypothetical protein
VIETDVSATIRIEGAKRGLDLMRNNSGAFEDSSGRWVRFGLGNDSKRVAAVRKSSDLIGTLDGRWWGYLDVWGLFAAVESKRPGWRYCGDEHERAQLNFINVVRSRGGFACFATSWDDVEHEINNFLAKRTYSASRPQGGGGRELARPHMPTCR